MKLGKFVNRNLSRFGVKLIRVKKEPEARPGNTYALDADDPSHIDIELRKLLNLISYTKTAGSPYDAQEFPSAYHTFRIGEYEFKGQRDPEQRLLDVPFDFDGVTVLDLGCNQGGMLFSIANRIKHGIGVDYDYRMVNAANRIRAYKQARNLDFYVFDLDKENLELLGNFLLGTAVDIVFLLSVCMWLKIWRAVIDAARSISRAMLFESNGTEEQQREQEAHLRLRYEVVTMIRATSTDDPGQLNRRLFLCRA